MRNFNKNNRSGNKGRFNRKDGNRPSMHHAVCDNCGKDCEVPFKPTGDKPIYCSDCFRNVEPKRSDGRGGQKPRFEKKMYKAVCVSCGKNCEVPFRPTEGKPVYCDDCFGKEGSSERKESAGGNKQLAEINAKLDEILKVLAKTATKEKAKTAKPKKTAAKKSTAKKTAKKKVAKKKK